MTEREALRAAAMVRATPRHDPCGRASRPASELYGARWRSLPVEDGRRDYERHEAGALRAFNVCLGLALAGAAYIFARFALSFL